MTNNENYSYAVYVIVDTPIIDAFRKDNSEDTNYADVCIIIDGEKRTMTMDEFKDRIFKV